MRILTYILILLIILFGISFAILNSQTVTVDYYFRQSNLPLSLLLVITFVFGSLLGMLVGLFLLLKVKIRNHQLKQRLKLADKEINNLRNIPLQDKV